jgi:hypothetical protein
MFVSGCEENKVMVWDISRLGEEIGDDELDEGGPELIVTKIL